MTDGIVCAGAAVVFGAIGDVYGVRTPLRDAEGPGSAGRHLLRARGPACGACAEGVLIQQIDGRRVGESAAGLLPFARFIVDAGLAQREDPFAGEGRVVVDDDLVFLDVPLARGHHIGPGILQHRDQEGEHVTLRIHVFNRPVQGSALPGPMARTRVEIAAVALPDGQVASAHPLGVAMAAFSLDEVTPQIAVGVVVLIRLGPAFEAQRRSDQFLDLHILGVDVPDLVIVIGRRQQFLQLGAEPLHVLLPPGEVPERLVEVEVQLAAAPDDFLERQPVLDRADAGIHAGDRVRRRPEIAQREVLRRPGGQDGEQQEEGGEDLLHRALRDWRIPLTSMRMKTTSELKARATASARKSFGSALR